MKIIVLHWHGVCPHCGKPSCIYSEFHRDEDGVKQPIGFCCGSCYSFITNEEFEKIKLKDSPCPKEAREEKES